MRSLLWSDIGVYFITQEWKKKNKEQMPKKYVVCTLKESLYIIKSLCLIFKFLRINKFYCNQCFSLKFIY